MRFYMLAFCLLFSGCGQPAPKEFAKPVQLIPREVLFGNPEKASPRISPDGKRLAYIAPVNNVLNVWVRTIGKTDDKPVSNDTERGIRHYWWACNDKHLLYLQDTGGDENWHVYRVDLETQESVCLTPFEGVLVDVWAFSKNSPDDILVMMNKENKKLFDLYQLNITTGELTLREKNPGNIKEWIIDSNLQARGAITFNADGGASLLVRATEHDAWKNLVTLDFDDTEGFSAFGFSHDGAKLYVKDSFQANARRLIEYDCKTGERTVLAQDTLFDVTEFIQNTDDKPLLAGLEKERCSWIALDPAFEPTLQAMQAIDSGDLFIGNMSADNRYWVIGFLHDNQTTKVYLFDVTENKAEFLFDVKAELNKYTLAPMEPVSFRARDGLKIYGYLTCPVGLESKNLPLILFVHGGPRMRDTWGLNSAAQWFANRGYACLQVNYRGSAGYGKQFVTAGFKEYGGKMQDDLVDAVAWAVAQGIADPKKIAIYGGSYGGYAALVGATFTPDLFCCAVDMCGMSNLITTFNSIPPYWEMFKKRFMKTMGDPEKDADMLKARSPLFKVNNIKIPVLIGQGANDPRVKQAESEQIVAAMKAKGLPYEYVLFPDEGHGFAKPKNRLKFNAIAEKFLAKNLGGRCQE